MFLQGFGEVITDILTMNPNYEDLGAASSILDTSNYTIQAITYGKDSDGFNFHGHAISSIEYVDGDPNNDVSSYNLNRMIVQNYDGNYPNYGSYNVSITHGYFSSTYNSLPNYPNLIDTRLERGSTVTNDASSFSATVLDLGHYPNTWIDPDLSSIWNVLGGFAPPSSAGVSYYLSAHGRPSPYASQVFSGMYNQYELADKYGYVTVNQTPGLINSDVASNLSGGPVIFSGAGVVGPDLGSVGLAIVPQRGDAASLALFGGVNHIGVYCLDIKDMLSSGLTPPYEWNALNNIRKYKLIAKVTYFDNLLTHEDYSTSAGINILNQGGEETLALLPVNLLLNKGPTFVLNLNFT